jgi:hypothetical protein
MMFAASVVKLAWLEFNPNDNYDESKDENLIKIRKETLSKCANGDDCTYFYDKDTKSVRLKRCPIGKKYYFNFLHRENNQNSGLVLTWQDKNDGLLYRGLVRPDGKVLHVNKGSKSWRDGLKAEIIDGYLVGYVDYSYYFFGKGEDPRYKFEE